MRLYKRHYYKLSALILITLPVVYYIKLQPSSHLTSSSSQSGLPVINSNNLLNNAGLSQKKHHRNDNTNDNSILGNHNDLDTLKKNLIIMRRYLQASSSDSKQNTNNTNLLQLSKDESDRSKKLVEDNAKTFMEIAELLEKAGYERKQNEGYRVLNSRSNPPISRNTNRREHQILKIREWEPFYVDFESEVNRNLNQDRLNYLMKKIQEWDPFYIDFPDEQSQDNILIHFDISESVVRELFTYVAKFEATRKPVEVPEPKKLDIYQSKHLESWQEFHEHITQYQLYLPEDPLLKQMITELRTLPFTRNYQPDSGTQQKVIFVMKNNLRVIFKPMRFSRKQEALPDHMFWRDYERHFAEIAAFHLDMVLGFHRVPPVVGRYVNVTSEVQGLDVKGDITTFISPAGNRCFYGKCDYYCDTAHAVCGRPDILEGSVMMYLPTTRYVPRVNWENPWIRTYSKTKPKAKWQFQYNFCDGVRATEPYNSGRALMDLMDMTVFDFLAGNMDRHHYETIEEFGNDTAPVLFDNGRGFGKAKHDELTILAPVYQCCLIRYTTLKKLLAFQQGPKHLSDAMRESLSKDLASPVLLEPHLLALDRRLKMILRTVHKCISTHGYSKVVKDDGF